MKMPQKERHDYINRELSWIAFNARVLAQSLDERTPLLEQARFSAIFSNNLDEFFMVRVASLKSQIEAGLNQKSEDGRTPSEQISAIRNALIPLLEEQQNHFLDSLKEQLKLYGIKILNYKDLNKREQTWLNNYFTNSIYPVLTPLVVDPAHPFPFLSNLSLNVAAFIKDPKNKETQFVRVKVPQKILGRFISIPNNLSGNDDDKISSRVPLEQVIGSNLHLLFPGMEVESHYIFRVTRDADLELRDLEADDLMIAIEESLRKRRMGGEIVRIEISEDMPKQMSSILLNSMGVSKDDLFSVKGLLGLDDLFEISKIDFAELKYPTHKGISQEPLKKIQLLKEHDNFHTNEVASIFSIIRHQDLLLHHPYDLFSTSIEEFINQAADDHLVMGIKMTLYRTSKDSPIIEALIRAAENGKQVMALVELKARFDEDKNIQWARQLEQAGVHVVYGIVGLKTHTKIVLVVRKEKENLRSYVHIGTGNYNSKTSKDYTDLGLLSARPKLGQDLVELFNYLTGFSKPQDFRKILVAPVTLRKRIEELITREIRHAEEGKPAHIQAKMNSLVDTAIIRLLYKASAAGVKIDLIVRGMCCLYPQKKGLSENIRVISIIGRFLEHSRIFWFKNHESSEVFIGSADWMRRNLDRRVEAVTPIEDKQLKDKLKKLLEIYLRDNRRAWEMQSDGQFIQLQPSGVEHCSQSELIELWGREDL